MVRVTVSIYLNFNLFINKEGLLIKMCSSFITLFLSSYRVDQSIHMFLIVLWNKNLGEHLLYWNMLQDISLFWMNSLCSWP